MIVIVHTSCQEIAWNSGPHVVIAGVAGSGKSTLGAAVARDLAAPLLDLDTLTAPLLDVLSPLLGSGHWNDSGDAAPLIRAGRYAVMRSVAEELTSVGVRSVMVAPFTRELQGGDEWAALLESVAPAPVVVVHVDGSEALLARRRADRGLDRDRHRADTPHSSPTVPHLRVDASLTTAQQLFRVRRALGLVSPPADRGGVVGRTFDAMLFDLDGTLVDSTAAVARCWAQVGDEYGFAVADIAHGMTAAESMALLLGDVEGPAAALRLGDLETRDVADVVPTPGALELFSALPASRVAIVTSGAPPVAHARLAAAGLAAPTAMVTSADVAHGKPDPEPYLLAARTLGIDPSRCLVVEDAPAGVRSARAAGCTVIGVGGTHDRADLDADLQVDTLDQLTVTLAEGGVTVSLR